MTGIRKNQPFTIAHADRGAIEGAGLGRFFEYRDLGIKAATGGASRTSVIRAVPGTQSPAVWRSHAIGFQMDYATRDWVDFEYDGSGEHPQRANSCVLQPPGIRHREVRHPDDLALPGVISLADVETRKEVAP